MTAQVCHGCEAGVVIGDICQGCGLPWEKWTNMRMENCQVHGEGVYSGGEPQSDADHERLGASVVAEMKADDARLKRDLAYFGRGLLLGFAISAAVGVAIWWMTR